MKTKLRGIITITTMVIMMGCTKEQMALPKKQHIALSTEQLTCQQKRDRAIQQQTDSIMQKYGWKLSMEYYDYIVYRDSMRNIYNGQRERNELTEEQWNHVMAELDMSWWRYQKQVENERDMKIQQIIQRLMSEYNCPQVPVNVENGMVRVTRGSGEENGMWKTED
jgi:hypothetical protein